MKYLYKTCIIAVCIVFCLASCDTMNDMHIGYLERGEKIYAAKVDSISPGPGDNRIEMEVFIYTQRIDRIRFFWNARSDSADFDIGNKAGSFKFMIENLPEREYLFEVVSFDKFGNKSLPFEVSGKSYGDNYKNYLLNRGINSMVKLDGKIHIIWSEPSEGALYTTIYYTTSAGVDVTINAPVDESETVIEDYLPASVFYYSTIYKPAINSPDIFETEKSTSTFNIFEYKDLDRTGWTSTQSHPRPSDSPSAIAHLDGDLSTFLSLTKPGKSAGGVSIPEGERLFCIIDMNEPRHFCYFRIRHRSETLGLRLWALSIYGSNDGENFSEIKSNIAIPDVQNGAVLESPNIEIPESYYRYVKIFYEEWDLVNNGAIQFTEFYLGMKE